MCFPDETEWVRLPSVIKEICIMASQRLALLVHSRKVTGSIPALNPPVWCLHVLPVLLWVLSRHSQSKDMHI